MSAIANKQRHGKELNTSFFMTQFGFAASLTQVWQVYHLALLHQRYKKRKNELDGQVQSKKSKESLVQKISLCVIIVMYIMFKVKHILYTYKDE